MTSQRGRGRLPLIAVSLAGALAASALTSCSTFDAPAARVNGSEISADTLENGVDGFETLLPDMLSSLQIDAAEGSAVSGDTGRFWLTYLIRRRLADRTLAALGGAITPEDVQQGETLVAGDAVAADLPPAIQEEIVATVAVNQAVQRAAVTPSPDVLEAEYAAAPASVGAMCLRHILVPTLDEAASVLAELRAGGDFADVATRRSHDPLAQQTGGALGSAEQPCALLSEMFGRYDPGFVAGALQAEPGVPTEPARSSFGYHIILVRPWAEVKDALIATIDSEPGQAAIYGAYATADVSVASKYGTWSPGSAAVVPLV